MPDGTKHDQGKTDWSLFPSKEAEPIVRVLMFGAKKYGAYNWRRGILYSRVYSAAIRHLHAWWGGETFDEESGENHLAHAACNLLFLLAFAQHEHVNELDDRP